MSGTFDIACPVEIALACVAKQGGLEATQGGSVDPIHVLGVFNADIEAGGKQQVASKIAWQTFGSQTVNLCRISGLFLLY